MAPRVVTADQAAKLVATGDTLLIGGSGAGHSVPDALIGAIGKRFLAEGEPRNLTAVHPVGLGDRANRGVGHLAHAGLLKRVVTGTLVDSPPVVRMAAANEIEAYTLPHFHRSAPRRRPAERKGDRRSRRTHDGRRQGISVLQVVPCRRRPGARHHRRRGWQHHDGA
jgi:acyl CoA:acetate/3-ketoacid CoA transferase